VGKPRVSLGKPGKTMIFPGKPTVDVKNYEKPMISLGSSNRDKPNLWGKPFKK